MKVQQIWILFVSCLIHSHSPILPLFQSLFLSLFFVWHTMFACLPVRQVVTNAFTLRKRYAQSIGHPPVRSLSQSSSQSVNHAVTLSIARSIRSARCTCQLEEIKMIWEKWKRRTHKRPSIETCRFVLLCLVPFAHLSFMTFPRYFTGNISGKLSGQSG